MFQKNETCTILEECHLMSNIPKRNLASGYRNGSLSADVAGIVHTIRNNRWMFGKMSELQPY